MEKTFQKIDKDIEDETSFYHHEYDDNHQQLVLLYHKSLATHGLQTRTEKYLEGLRSQEIPAENKRTNPVRYFRRMPSPESRMAINENVNNALKGAAAENIKRFLIISDLCSPFDNKKVASPNADGPL